MKYEDFVQRFPQKQKTQRGYLVVCPAHDDSVKGKSLHVCPSKDGGVLVNCFAGCSPEQVMGALGLKLKDLFADSEPVKFNPPAPRKEQPAAVPTAEAKPVVDKIYQYHDALGRDAYQVIRLKPKSFRQRHKVGDEWKWNMDGVERYLYRLPQITKAQQVFIVEGEKDAENLVALGFCATCNVGGAGKWLDSYSSCLAGKDVVICGDNDEPGEKHVKLVFYSIAETAKSVRILKLPKTAKDASDFIAAFKNQEEAKSAINGLLSEAHPHIKGHHLPVYTISEIESEYRQFVRSMSEHAYSLGQWLPTLGIKIRRLVPGELVFIIGDTGTGKTGLLQNIAKSAKDMPRIMFEFELPKEIMFERFVSISARLSGEDVERNYQTCDDSLSEGLEKVYKGLLICPVSRMTVAKMEEIVLRSELKLGERPRMVLVDYLQLIQGAGKSRYEKFSDIAEELKVMAKATRTIVIVTSQISRPNEITEDWEPTLHSAKESGSIENSCGLLISAWQDLKERGVLNLRVLKSTKGGTGTLVKCNFDGAKMIINERSRIDDRDVPQTPYRDE